MSGTRKSFSKMPSYTYGIFVVNKHERPNIGPSRQAYFEKIPISYIVANVDFEVLLLFSKS